MHFSKYQGLGNDFILLDAREHPSAITPGLAAKLCHRSRGIGADGLITLFPSSVPGCDLRMHIFNADGSQAEMCGNGLRCVVQFVLAGQRPRNLTIETAAGVRQGWREEDGTVRVTLGSAQLLAAEVDASLPTEALQGIGISMGNPHLVLHPGARTEDPLAQARRVGPILEHHPMFEHRTNVGCLRVSGPQAIDLAVFERGAGLTQACGTGAGAAAVAAVRWGLVTSASPIAVRLPGGLLQVEVKGDPASALRSGDTLAHVTIRGEARYVFNGTVGVDAF